jgi:hypothetical protein
MTRTAQIRARLDKATPGPWELHDSCSWRRIGTPERDGNVLCPTIASDGHPDLNGGYDNLLLIASAPEDLKYLLDRLEMAEELLKRAEKHIPLSGNISDHSSIKPLRLSTEIAAFIGGEEK